MNLVSSQTLFFFLTLSSSYGQDEYIESMDYYCGTTWPDAASACTHHCPSGASTECIDMLGEGYECHKFTGCSERIENGEIVEDNSNGVVNAVDNVIDAVEDVISEGGNNNNFCGISWIDAMFTCGIPCPLGNECPQQDDQDSASSSSSSLNTSPIKCFAATNCDKPLARLVADMLITMIGPETIMDDTDGQILGSTISDILRDVVEEEGVALDGVDLGEQTLAGRRELEGRYMHRELKGWHKEYGNNGVLQMKVTNVTVTQRMLQGSSALDVSMIITGDYRPPPYLDLNVIAEESINRQGEKLVSTLRERGNQAGRKFFEAVEGVEALAKEKSTSRPTGNPTPGPTKSPTIDPSSTPSMAPSVTTSCEYCIYIGSLLFNLRSVHGCLNLKFSSQLTKIYCSVAYV